MRTFKEIIQEEAKQPYYIELHQYVEDQYQKYTCFPPHKQIYHAFNFCDYEDIKVVILGQDPYHERHQANGLAFSVNKGIRIPPSLVNIYKEAMEDVGIPQPHSGDLTPWARQGVLLLNTVLTVREHQANSHKGHGWETFTDHIVEIMNEREKPLVFILWGNQARQKARMIYPRHLVIQSPHPSPLSASRGFFHSHPFSRCNDFLIANGQTPIDWRID